MTIPQDLEQDISNTKRRKMTFATGVKSKIWEYQNKAKDPNFQKFLKLLQAKVSLIAESFEFHYTLGYLGHAFKGREKDEIWAALKSKNVYGTSGP